MSPSDDYPAWLNIACPECSNTLDLGRLQCQEGHLFETRHGVPALLGSEFASRLGVFLKAFESYRADRELRLADTEGLVHLPHGPLAKSSFEWRLRQAGWHLLNGQILNDPGLRILDIGAWNGWLSHRLTEAGQDVLAVDYFTDPLDGLGARQFYPITWPVLQIDLEDLTILGRHFDLVIFNHCFQFFIDPERTLDQARALLRGGGRIVLLGLAFFKNPRVQEERVRAYRADFNRAGFDFFKEMRGLLDFDNRRSLLDLGVNLRPYPEFWRANLRSRLQPGRPRYEFGTTEAA